MFGEDPKRVSIRVIHILIVPVYRLCLVVQDQAISLGYERKPHTQTDAPAVEPRIAHTPNEQSRGEQSKFVKYEDMKIQKNINNN
jgi:hypothetical protein